MIQANELRIGNWVYCKGYYGEGYVKVENVNDAGINGEWDANWVTYGDDEISGIPITAEILKKCGLVKDEDESTGVQYNGEQSGCTIHYTLDDNCLILDFENEYTVRNNLMIYGIKFLHTMQNAFYLTGTELEINLTE